MNCGFSGFLIFLSLAGLLGFICESAKWEYYEYYLLGGSLLNLNIAHLSLLVIRGTSAIRLCAKTAVAYCHHPLNIAFTAGMIYYYEILRCESYMFLLDFTVSVAILLQVFHLGLFFYYLYVIFLRSVHRDTSIQVSEIESPLLGDTDGPDECPICLEFLNKNQPMAKLPCEHVYHIECFNEWVNRNKNCPLCRLEFE